jgi:hypothetical protein
MAQFDPVQDFALPSRGLRRARGDDAPAPDVFFIHANFPKFNPATVFEIHEVNPTYTDEGEYTRAWTLPVDVVRGFNSRVDVEKGFWEEILWTACELEDKFQSWLAYEGICDAVSVYWGGLIVLLSCWSDIWHDELLKSYSPFLHVSLLESITSAFPPWLSLPYCFVQAVVGH